jgi:hypothetical protein
LDSSEGSNTRKMKHWGTLNRVAHAQAKASIRFARVLATLDALGLLKIKLGIKEYFNNICCAFFLVCEMCYELIKAYFKFRVPKKRSMAKQATMKEFR